MAFNSSYIYQIIDKFSPAAKKIAAAAAAAKKSIQQMNNSARAGAKAFDNLSERVSASVNRANMAAAGMSNAAGTVFNSVGRMGRMSDAVTKKITKNHFTQKNSFVSLSQSVTSNVDGMMEQVGRLAVIAGLVFTLAFPIREAMQFETAMADVNKVVEFASQGGLANMADGLRELSKRIPVAATGLADIAAAGGQFGIAEDKILAFTEQVSKISVAFDLMPDEAGVAAAKISNIFGMQVDKFIDFADQANYVSNNVAASADEIIRSLLNKGAAAGKAMQLTATDTMGLAASFVQMGVNADRVGSIMDAMSRRLSDTSVVGEKFAQNFTEKPRETLIKLLRQIQKMPEGAKKTQFLTETFTEFGGRVGALANTMDRVLLPTLALANNRIAGAGSVTEEFRKRSKTAENALTLMGNSFRSMSGAIGNNFLPAVVASAEVLSSLFNGIESIADATGPLIPMLIGAAGAILLVKAATIAWTVAQTALNVAMAVSPIGRVIAAITALGIGIAWLWDKLVKAKDMVVEFFSAISPLRAVGSIFKMMGVGSEQLGKNLTYATDKAKKLNDEMSRPVDKNMNMQTTGDGMMLNGGAGYTQQGAEAVQNRGQQTIGGRVDLNITKPDDFDVEANVMTDGFDMPAAVNMEGF